MIDWLKDAVEVHVHASPSMYPRLLDDNELAAAAEAAGMHAVLLKAHEGYTMERATMAQKTVKKVRVVGGVALNHFVGGFNPHAVAYAITMGARMVWMPTLHSANHIKARGGARFADQKSGMEDLHVEPLTVLDEKGKLKKEVHEILDLMAGKGVALGSGHLHRTEIDVLFREAHRRGVERMIITHAESPIKETHVAFQKEMAGLGVFIERCYLAHHKGRITFDQTAAEIREVGIGRIVLETDFGQASNPTPASGLQDFCEQLHQRDFSERDVRRMVSANPAELLGLPLA